jgi:uncharacterized protein YbjQ (UPF0145 family)
MEIAGLIYCEQCAQESRASIEEKKEDIQKEKDKIVRVGNVIEKELELVSEDETRHIAVSTTDTIQDSTILEYLDIISVPDVQFEIIHFDPAQAESQDGRVQEFMRNSIELSLSSLKKKAYLLGANAVVGVRIESAIDHQREGDYMAALMLEIHAYGTAVRLAETDIRV